MNIDDSRTVIKACVDLLTLAYLLSGDTDRDRVAGSVKADLEHIAEAGRPLEAIAGTARRVLEIAEGGGR